MYRKEDIPKRLRLAILMLIAMLFMSLQQQVVHNLFSTSVKKVVETEKQLILKPSTGTGHALGILHDDSQTAFAAVVALTFILALFPLLQERKVYSFTPVTLSRNFCCIVPKGP